MRIRLSRFLAAAAILAIFTATLATLPLLAQQGDERVEIIMGGLPPNGSPEYKKLLKFAGDAKGQVLSLTKCEMWSVRRSKLDALRKAAAARGVSVKVLDHSWNEMFAPASKTEAMDDKQKSMMDLAMKSKSTASMGMMSARAANMVEYALTKGMGEKKDGAAARPMTIKIAISDKKTVTAVRRDVVITGDKCTWRGVVEGTENPVTIMWWASGRVTGTIHHGDRLYQIKHMGGDMIGVVETMTNMMPDEHAPTSPKRMREMKMDKDKSVIEGDASMGRPKRGETQNQQDDVTKGAPRPKDKNSALKKQIETAAARKGGKGAAANPGVVIDLMIAYTAKAAAHYSDIRKDLIELAVEETNQSFRASKIDNVAVRLVHVHQTDYKEEGAEHFDHLWRMADKGDGFLEEIPVLRDRHKADVVILVVDDAQGCGLATRVAADAEEAYAVVHHECAATSYSVAHELGHIIGTRHDRALDQSTTPFPFGHGYVSPDLKWRTMMSYKANCNGCPRLPIWSTPLRVVSGQPAGTENVDNARVIREQAARVAAFR